MENERLYQTRDRRQRTRAAAAPVTAETAEKPAKRDAFVRLLTVQCIVAAAAVLTVFLLGRAGSAAFDEIKDACSSAMERDMSAAEIFDCFRQSAAGVFAADDTSADVTAPESGEETARTNTAGLMGEMGEEAGETVAVGEMNSAGGSDESSEEAAKGTSFAMYEISEKPAMPVSSERITSGFGYRVNPVSGRYGFHTGIDLSSPSGAPISAVFFGVVEETGEDDAWGKYVLIKHSDGLETYYCHCSEVLVSEGAVIRKGERIALVGTTGQSTGPHLHFEVRIGGIRVDPAILLFGKRS